MNTNLRLSEEAQHTDANGQADPSPVQPLLWTVNDLAKALSCSRRTIERLEAARREKVPADSPTLWRADWHWRRRQGQEILGTKGKG